MSPRPTMLAAPGVKVGFLPQEPVLDPSKNVLGNIEEAVRPIKALLERFDAINAKFAEPMEPEEMDKLTRGGRGGGKKQGKKKQ